MCAGEIKRADMAVAKEAVATSVLGSASSVSNSALRFAGLELSSPICAD